MLQFRRKFEEAVIIPHDSTVSNKIAKKSENINKIRILSENTNNITLNHNNL